MISDTLYGKYIQERQGAKILENPSAFIIYVLNGRECFIVDMSVDTEMRREGCGRELVDKLTVIAKDYGCEFITGNIHIKFENHTEVLSAAIRCGFYLVGAHDGTITIAKKVEA